jgi:hypothetical protein
MLTKDIVLNKYCKKKVSYFPVPSWDVIYQTLSGVEYFNYSRPGESLVSDVLAGDGKIFFTVYFDPKASGIL